MKKIRLAVVGCGSIGVEHIRALKTVPAAEIYAVASRDRRRRANAERLAGAKRAEADYRRLLRDEKLAGVVLCTPTHTHYEFSREVLRAGKHLLLEKPMTGSFRKSKSLVEMAGRRGLCLMVAQTQRFIPAYALCQRRIAQGRIGRPLLVTGRWMEERRTPRNWQGKMTEMAQQVGDSLIYHHGSHTVDFVLWALGAEPEKVYAASVTANAAIVRDSDFSILFRTRSGCVVSLSHSFSSGVQDQSLIIVGERATLRVTEHTRLEENGRTLVEGTFDEQLAKGIRAQDAEFVREIRQGSQPLASGQEVLRSMAVLAEASRLARRGRSSEPGP